MLRQPVISSRIKSIGWENETLEIEFANGAIFLYRGVPESVYRELGKAESKGKFFHHAIRGQFAYERAA